MHRCNSLNVMTTEWISFFKPKFKHLVRFTLNRTEHYNSECSSEYIVITILVVLLLLIGSLVILVGYFFLQEAHKILPVVSKGAIQTLPVLCEDLSLSADEDFGFFDLRKNRLNVYVSSGGKYICVHSNFKTTIYKNVERQSRLRQSKGLDIPQYLSCGNERLARKSGELTVSFTKVSHHQTYPDGSDVILHWDKHSNHSYIDPVFSYYNGEISIPEGRTYFVYASVHFNISRDLKNTVKSRRFTLQICRKVNSYEYTLLGKSELLYLSKEVVYSLNVASLLQLNRNDIIYVKVSNADIIIPESRGTTFGLFPL